MAGAGGTALEARARELYTARSYAALSAALEAEPRAVLLTTPQLVFWLADAWRRTGRGVDALQLLRAASASFNRRGNDALHRQRANLEGMLRFEVGDIAGAEVAWRELLTAASAAGDDDFVARANNNLGIICTLHGRSEEAIACYQRALAAYRSIGRRRGLAQAHQNLAITYRELDFPPKADHHFLQAIRYAAADRSEDEVARAEQERALLIYVAGRDARLARATAERALARFEALRDEGGRADTLRVLGMIDLGEGELERAERLLQTALHRAQQARLPLLQAETLEALAVVAEQQARGDDAVGLRARATALFAEVGAVEWGARTRARVERLAAVRV